MLILSLHSNEIRYFNLMCLLLPLLRFQMVIHKEIILKRVKKALTFKSIHNWRPKWSNDILQKFKFEKIQVKTLGCKFYSFMLFMVSSV